MAAFRAQANGDIVQFMNSYQQEKQNPWNPTLFPFQVQFDEKTNAGLISAYNANSAQFRMDGGTLTQNGIPATIFPPEPFYEAFLHAAEMLTKAKSQVQPPPTTEEMWRICAVAFRGAGLD